MSDNKVLNYVVICVLAAGLGFFAAFNIFKPPATLSANDAPSVASEAAQAATGPIEALALAGALEAARAEANVARNEPNSAHDADADDTEAVSAITDQTISPSTKMIYEYYYEGDGIVEQSEEEPPYFLIGLNREQLVDAYQDWTVKYFSSSEVVMNKNVPGVSSRHYIIGVYDEMVAVFYQQDINGVSLKEVTDTPVSSLAPEEQQRLLEGIEIVGEEQLIKALEDYGS